MTSLPFRLFTRHPLPLIPNAQKSPFEEWSKRCHVHFTVDNAFSGVIRSLARAGFSRGFYEYVTTVEADTLEDAAKHRQIRLGDVIVDEHGNAFVNEFYGFSWMAMNERDVKGIAYN